MLDERSKIILKFLALECSEGSYRVIDTSELVSCLPKKFKADEGVVALCMEYLQKGNYISIKYKDSKMYCVTPLPFARQLLENESNLKQKSKKAIKIGLIMYILVFIFAFLGSFLAILLYALIF